MQKIMKKLAAFALMFALCIGIVSIPVNVPAVTVADADVTSTEGNYYSGITADSGNALLGQIHDLIVNTHTKYTSYKECKTYASQTDPSGSGVLEFYTHETMTSFSGTKGTWNREHVWPQNLSNGLWGESGAGSDMHHIRPSEGMLNNSRGSKKYGNVTNGTAEYSKTTSGANSELGGYSNSSTFMPLDNVKGDAARIVMYVYTHYNKGANVHGTVDSRGSGTLDFTDVMAPSTESAAIKLLLEWNKLDPVDDIEMRRNNEAFKVQGNRNPFIDHPEFASAIWGDGSYVGGGGSQGGGDGGTTTPTETFTPLAEPQEGTFYYAMNSDSNYHYATGNMVKTYYFETTTDISGAAQFTLSKQGDGWTIKQGSRYVEIALNDGHINAVYNTAQTSGKTWKWDSAHGFFLWDDLYYIGNYGNNKDSFAGLTMEKYAEDNYIAQFGTYGTSGGSQGGQGGGQTEHTHTYVYQPYNAQEHTKTCSGCSEVNVREPHAYTDAADTTCNECGYTRTIGGGTQGGGTGTSGSFTITLDSFTLTDGYGFKPWTSGGVSGIAYVFGGNGDFSPTGMQFQKKQTSYYLASTTPTGGAITSITVKKYDDASSQDREWKLLTSTTPYGEVAGKPTNGTDQGTKTVTADGVTWTLDGNDTYFALTFELEKESGACYLDSITVQYSGGTQGGEPHTHTYEYRQCDPADPDYHLAVCTGCGEEIRLPHEYAEGGTVCEHCGYDKSAAGQTGGDKVAAFHTAVEGIVTEGSVADRFASINTALKAYRALTDSEKTAAEADVKKLQDAIEAYNKFVNGCNADMDEANKGAIGGVSGLLRG